MLVALWQFDKEVGEPDCCCSGCSIISHRLRSHCSFWASVKFGSISTGTRRGRVQNWITSVTAPIRSEIEAKKPDAD